MITAYDLQRAMSVLQRVEHLTLAQSVDNVYMSTLRVDAMLSAIAIKYALLPVQVEIDKKITLETVAASQC